MKTSIALLISVLSISGTFAQEKGTPLVLQHIQVVPIQDTQANKQYELYIEVPEDYAEHPNKKYPVIYYTDAMWHMEILSASMEYIMNDVILVGISWQKDINEALVKEHGHHVSRYRDYSVIPSNNPETQAKYELGQAANHLAFIRNDVIPFVEGKYRTNPDSRSYFGYSAGGVFGAYSLLAQPDTFKNYILGSPALDGDIPFLSQLESSQNLNANVFIAYGTLEDEASKHVEEFITLLKNRNDKTLSLEHVVIEGSHQTAFPLTGIQSVIWLSKINSSSVLEAPYLGQKVPGLVPELFAPDIIQTEHREAAAAFSPDLKEFYFRRRGGDYKNNTLVVIKYKDNEWTESVVPPRPGEPFISTDNKLLFLGNKFRERTNAGWSEVKSLGAPFDDIPIMRLTASSRGTYYFDEATEIGAIRYSRLIDGKHENPLEVDIEMGKWKAHPFIAPDESYLIWDDESEGGYGDNDLYISFRLQDGSWSAAINLGDKINTEFAEAYGSVSPDGKYFFFHRGFGGDTGDIFWVDAQVIEALRPNN